MAKILKNSSAIILCVLISIFGITFFAYSVTVLSDNIDTAGNITASSTITAGELLTVVPTSFTPTVVGYILDDESPEGVGSAHALEYALKVYVSGKYAYVTSIDDSGLSIIDISDPTNPVEAGYIQDNSQPGGTATVLNHPEGVFVSGKYAYISSWIDDSLSIIDVSNPSHPTEVGYVLDNSQGGTASTLDGACEVYVVGNYAYVTAFYDHGLSIINISNPTNPVEVGYIRDNSVGGSAQALKLPINLYVSGRYAYVAGNGDSGLSIIDISDPTNPVEVGYILDDSNGGTATTLASITGVYVSGEYAYVVAGLATADDALTIINISDPTTPFVAGYIQDNSHAGGTAHALDGAGEVYVLGDYAYVSSRYDDALSIFDISSPANPIEVGYILDNESPEGVGTAVALHYVYGFAVSGEYAYVTGAYDDGLSIIQLPSADLPTANINDLSASTIEVTENMIVGNDLSVQSGLNVGPGGLLVGGEVGISASSTLTSTSSQPALSVVQNGSGNIVEFKDAGAKVFYIADGGNATTTGNLNVSRTLNIGGGTPIAKHLSATSSVDFDAIGANSCAIKTASFPGVAVGDSVDLGIPDALESLGELSWRGWVSSADIVSVKACNASTSASSNPPEAAVRISAWKY